PLHDVQGRRGRLHALAGAGAGAARHPRQRTGARLHAFRREREEHLGGAQALQPRVAHAQARRGARGPRGDVGLPRLRRQRVHVRPDTARGRWRERSSCAAAAHKRLRGVSVLAATAGIYPNTPVVDMDVEEWDRVMETNARGVFLTCRAAARSMVAHDTPGKIITIASGAYASGRPGAAHYCASKAAVVMFTKVLALELAKARINVNCIAPGFVRVDSEVSPLTEEYVTTLTRGIPWGRQGTPRDIANAALFL